MGLRSSRVGPFQGLSAYAESSDELHVIIETPRGRRNKYNFDEELGLFKLGGVLPAGAVFPFDFGFVPSTVGGDGDPLDVLVLMDEAAFTGCLVPARLIGVIEAEQTERDGETTRNDRLIAVAADSRTHQDVRSLEDLNDSLLDEIEHFFVSYNQVKGKEFKPLGRFGPKQARSLIAEGIQSFKRKHARRNGAKKRSRSKAKKSRR
ncbi:MAG TPA: inorganic diphosphatase [Pyrinomonadaceae bacterium]|jgi:inorganic pyrophosphatase